MRSEINQKSEVVEGKLFVECSTAVATLLSSRICDGVNGVRDFRGFGKQENQKITQERLG